MNSELLENLNKLKKMLVLLSEERKVVMRSIVNESIKIAENE
jgi:hypothetical protein